jgi:hypothetical protein
LFRGSHHLQREIARAESTRNRQDELRPARYDRNGFQQLNRRLRADDCKLGDI